MDKRYLKPPIPPRAGTVLSKENCNNLVFMYGNAVSNDKTVSVKEREP